MFLFMSSVELHAGRLAAGAAAAGVFVNGVVFVEAAPPGAGVR